MGAAIFQTRPAICWCCSAGILACLLQDAVLKTAQQAFTAHGQMPCLQIHARSSSCCDACWLCMQLWRLAHVAAAAQLGACVLPSASCAVT